MEKVNFTISREAYQHIVLAHAFQSVQKQVDTCLNECSDDDTHTLLVNIDNQITDMLEKLSLTIGFEMIKE